MLTDVEKDYAVAKAKAKHRTKFGWMGDSAPAFTADAAATAIADALTAKVHQSAQQMRLGADPLNDPDFRRGADIARRVTGKRILADGWRQ